MSLSKLLQSGRGRVLLEYRRLQVFLLGVGLLAGAAGPVSSQAIPDTLWLGTDNRSDLMIVNVSKTGTVLRSLGPREGTGLAILGSNVDVSTR